MFSRVFFFICFLQLHCLVSLGKGINPKTWTNGKLYEFIESEDGYVHCLYINPGGTFICLMDEGNGSMHDFSGLWTRNILNGRMRFIYFNDVKFAPLHETYCLFSEGLYSLTSNSLKFIPAREKVSSFILHQIKGFMNGENLYGGFFAMSEIGRKTHTNPWHLDSLSFSPARMLDTLKQSELRAQSESNEYYLKEETQRKDWKDLYPSAWNFASNEFNPLSSDTAKIRAMCNWIAENIEYKLKESCEQNPSHNPEFVYTEHFGICLDYSLLLNVFCESVGIPCFDVYGYPLTSTQGKQRSPGNTYHAWNFVKVNGTWKAVDPTWYKSNKPGEHFLEDLSAYQYERVPDNPAILANPFGPLSKDQREICPVVKQANMDIIYMGNFDNITVANGDSLDITLYSSIETELELEVDTADRTHNLAYISLCFGCIEIIKPEPKIVYHLTYGLNRLSIPLRSNLWKYTLSNENFQIEFIVSPLRDQVAAFKTMTYYDEERFAELDSVYRFFEKWLNGDTATMIDIDQDLRDHPNWEYLRKDYRNEELHARKSHNKNRAEYFFGRYSIGGLRPYIAIELDDSGKVVGRPRLLLGY